MIQRWITNILTTIKRELASLKHLDPYIWHSDTAEEMTSDDVVCKQTNTTKSNKMVKKKDNQDN